MAGRVTNDLMKKFIIDYIKKKLSRYNYSSKTKILIVGLSYKYAVADLRNSLNLEIYKNIKKSYTNTFFYDPFLKNSIILSKEINKKYLVINFLKLES